MLMPKRVKYRKQMRGRMNGVSLRGATVEFVLPDSGCGEA